MKKLKAFLTGLTVMLLITVNIGIINVTAAAEDCKIRERNTIENSAYSEGSQKRILTVIMYHQVLKKSRGSYIISPEIFEEDLKELLKRGYETVFPSQVIRFVESGAELPEKPLLITIDDGHYNAPYYCKPILEKYKCRALINVVGVYSEFSTKSGDHSKVDYSYLTWGQIRELSNQGIFEFGNHTYNMHKFKPRRGISRICGESESQYKAALKKDISKLQDKLADECGVVSSCFAYPFGLYDSTAKETIIAMGFKMIMNCFERRNSIAVGNRACLYSLCRFNRVPTLTSSSFFDKIEKTPCNTAPA